MRRVPRPLARVAARVLAPAFAPCAKARVLRWVARSPLRTRLWYATRHAYAREQQAMLAGIAAYHEAEADRRRGPLYRLRRDVHRLEKGLAAPERRGRFGESYVGDAVDAFEKVARACAASDDPRLGPTVAWAADVLTRYFESVDPSGVVDVARARFTRAVAGASHDGSRVPRPKDASESPVSYPELLALARRRRSVRVFLPEPVPRAVVDAALEVARQSPSACNRQAFEFRVYDEPAVVEDLVDLAPGFDGYGRKVPCLIVVVGKYRAYFRERDMHVIYVDASLAAMAAVLAFETLGYASCCINWPSIPARDRALADFLRLDADEEVVMLLAVGRADRDVSSPFSEKAPLESVRSFNRR